LIDVGLTSILGRFPDLRLGAVPEGLSNHVSRLTGDLESLPVVWSRSSSSQSRTFGLRASD
jgi:hypothetical protein